ncbi:MAG TPA: hypothetical protein DDY20_02630 [Desulfobulbaceae bacterium]|nr:hypothetical protein [Desulfobulbaceae bacterium]
MSPGNLNLRERRGTGDISYFTFDKKNPFEHVWEGGEVSPFQLQKGLNEDSSSAEVASLLRRLINLFIKIIPNAGQ